MKNPLLPISNNINYFNTLNGKCEQFEFVSNLWKLTGIISFLWIQSYIPTFHIPTFKRTKVTPIKKYKLADNVIDLSEKNYSYEQIEKYSIVKQKHKRGLTSVYAYFEIQIQILLKHKYGFDNFYLQLLQSNPYYAKQILKIKKIYKYNYLDIFTYFELIHFIQTIPNKGRLLDLCFERLNYTQKI